MAEYYRYYDDLSGDSSISDGSDSDNDGDEEEPRNGGVVGGITTKSWLHELQTDERCIIHADVDCFYCQCEIIDRKLDPSRPLAIGQKHIIVTCNYSARKVGITKLMNREEAKRKCSYLLIVDGSDLERYRIHARKIYECFRRSCKQYNINNQICKGSMDEMMADMTDTDTTQQHINLSSFQNNDSSIYVYGQNGNNETIVMTEDQSGAETYFRLDTTTITNNNNSRSSSTILQQQQKLYKLAYVAIQIRQNILNETGFTITMGVSVNPLLAKIASGLKKPGIVNVLLPNRLCTQLIANMPLRKIPSIGSRTMKVLKSCLIQHHYGNNNDNNNEASIQTWTCRDLLQVPKTSVANALKKINIGGGHDEISNCERIYQLCTGYDNSNIIDDNGGLQKTLSVEDSYRRNTICSKGKVLSVIEDLYVRLPRLFANRFDWSTNKDYAYPITIRLTVRYIDPTLLATMSNSNNKNRHQQRRIHITKSQQTTFDGKKFLYMEEKTNQSKLIREYVTPLIHSLIFSPLKDKLNITKLNIALCNFQDVIVTSTSSPSSNNKIGVKKKVIEVDQSPFVPVTSSLVTKSLPVKSDRNDSKHINDETADRKRTSSSSPKHCATIKSAKKQKKTIKTYNTAATDSNVYDEYDPTVLAELPPDIVAELQQNIQKQSKKSLKQTKNRIDHFFAKK